MAKRPLFFVLLLGIFGATGYFSYSLYKTYYGSSTGLSYKGYFDGIGDLNVGHMVKIHGLPVGRVVSVSLSPDQQGVHVSFLLEKGLTLNSDVSLVIEQGLLMGDPCLTIKPGSSKTPLDPNILIQNTYPPLQILSLVQKFISSGSANAVKEKLSPKS